MTASAAIPATTAPAAVDYWAVERLPVEQARPLATEPGLFARVLFLLIKYLGTPVSDDHGSV